MILLIILSVILDISGNGSGEWIIRSLPKGRIFSSVIYDGTNGSIIVFGGNEYKTGDKFKSRYEFALGDTWQMNQFKEWSVPNLNKSQLKGPGARWGHSLSYNNQNGSSVLFGGKSILNVFRESKSTRIFDDTWVWNGNTWKNLKVVGPSKRYAQASVFHSSTGEIILFGGRNKNDHFSDTWSFKNHVWEKVSQVGPDKRAYHSMVYDRVREETILFGGQWSHPFGKSVYSDTWIWNGKEWKKIIESGPKARFAHSMVYDDKNQRVILFGGIGNNSDILSDLWVWDGTNWKLITNNAGLSSFGHSTVVNSNTGDVLLFGGVNSNKSNPSANVYVLNNNKWELYAVSNQPVGRSGSAFAYDHRNKMLILHGGSPQIWKFDKSILKNTWGWDGAKWHLLSSRGPDLLDLLMIYDHKRQQIVLYGVPREKDEREQRGETWIWNGKKWKLKSTILLPNTEFWGHVSRCSMTYDHNSERIYFFSPRRLKDNSLWAWNGKKWELLVYSPKIGPFFNNTIPNSNLGFDKANNRVILYHEFKTFELTEKKKKKLGTRSPRLECESVVINSGDELLLFGYRYWNKSGEKASKRELWKWDGIKWKRVRITLPDSKGAAWGYDFGNKNIVVFGGNTILSDSFRQANSNFIWTHDYP